MRKVLSTVAAVTVLSAVAYAASDIPTRYSGSFPSAGPFNNVTGTFTGSSLSLKYTFIRGGNFTPTTANYSCRKGGPSNSICSGSWRSDDSRFQGKNNVRVTWSAGQPTALKFHH